MSKRRDVFNHSREHVFSVTDAAGSKSRGVFAIKENRENGRLFALICHRWCRVERDKTGQLVERFEE